jgi:hypothetical protein
MAYFCTKTGVRIAAPGVSKEVDPVSGQDQYTEPGPDAPSEAETKPKAKAEPAKGNAPKGAKASAEQTPSMPPGDPPPQAAVDSTTKDK